MTEPDADSTINHADRAERERIMLRKMFRTLQSTEGVYIHDELATRKVRGLDSPEQLQSVLAEYDLSSP